MKLQNICLMPQHLYKIYHESRGSKYEKGLFNSAEKWYNIKVLSDMHLTEMPSDIREIILLYIAPVLCTGA